MGRRHHIEGGQFHPGSHLGHLWVHLSSSCFLSASLAAVVDRNMDTAFASSSQSRVLLQRLSLLSDCCNDNPRPVICTLQLPSSTSACIFSPLRRPWPDSHLRREALPLLVIYSPIKAHRSSPLSCGRREEALTLIVNTFCLPMRPFSRGLVSLLLGFLSNFEFF